MLFSSAFAQETAGAAAEQSPIIGFLPIILIMGIFYFLIFRPQQKRYKNHATMLSALKKGDKVVTAGGIIGKISKVDEDVVHVQIADTVTIQVAKSTIASAHEDQLASVKADKKQTKKSVAKNSDNSIANDN